MTVDVASHAFKRDPHEALKEVVQDGHNFIELRMPIVGKIKAFLPHHVSREFLKNTDAFVMDGRRAGRKTQLGYGWLPKSMRLVANNMLMMDDPDHGRIRSLSNGPFLRSSIDGRRDIIRARVAGLFEAMEADANTDIVSGLARPLPVEVITEVLGLSDERASILNGVMANFSGSGARVAILKSTLMLGKIRRLFMEEIEAARAMPSGGLLSDLAHAKDNAGVGLTDDELFSTVFLLYAAGQDTTTHLITSSVYALLTEEGVWEEFRDLPDEAVSIAVDELMRFCSPVQFTKPRLVAYDMDFNGVALKRGERVTALLAAGNIDEAVFDDPLTLKLDRRPNRHLGWGGGPHICLGLHLAKLEVEETLLALRARAPNLSIDADPQSLNWIKRLGLRGVEHFPLNFG